VDNRYPILMLAFWCVAIYLWVAFGLFWLKNALLTMGVYHTALCGGGWLLLRPKRLLRFDAKQSGIAMLALVSGFALTWLTMEYIFPLLPPQALPDVTTRTLDALGLNARSYLSIAIYFGLVNPLAEEAIWRGRILPILADMRSFAPNLLHAILFSGFHIVPLMLMFSNAWLPGIVVFLGGFAFGLLALRTRGLLIAWALHTGINAYLLIWFGRFIIAGS
jgi:membrane protease YdiL (CAAX protease family)